MDYRVEVTINMYEQYTGIHDKFYAPIQKTVIEYYGTKEEALASFLRKDYGDFYCGAGVDDERIIIVQDDEGGVYRITLHKWEGFEKDVRVKYTAYTNSRECLGTFMTEDDACKELRKYYGVEKGGLALSVDSDYSDNGCLVLNATDAVTHSEEYGSVSMELCISDELAERVSKLRQIPGSYHDVSQLDRKLPVDRETRGTKQDEKPEQSPF